MKHTTQPINEACTFEKAENNKFVLHNSGGPAVQNRALKNWQKKIRKRIQTKIIYRRRNEFAFEQQFEIEGTNRYPFLLQL